MVTTNKSSPAFEVENGLVFLRRGRLRVWEVSRFAVEKPFAKIYSPRASGMRKWQVRYAQFAGDRFPPDSAINFSASTKEHVVREVEYISRVCSTYQLGLCEEPNG